MPIVFSSGETLGRLRFGAQIGRFQDSILYHAVDEVKRRDVLVRQYAPEEPEKAMSGLPAAGRHAKSRWDQLLDIQLQRFELARKSLPAASPYHVSLVDYLLDDTFYAIMAHPAAPELSADFCDIKSPSEPALHQLLLPIMEVLAGLHKNRVLYCGLGPEEILLDRTDPGSLGVPVFAGFGSVYHWGGMGPPRPRADDRPSWAPECYDRQAPLTAAADVYALGALTYQLMTGMPPAPARARLKGSEHPSLTELAPSYSSSLRRAVEQALALDPEARFPTVKAFRELALPAVTQAPPRSAAAPVNPRRPKAAAPAARRAARPRGPSPGEQIGALLAQAHAAGTALANAAGAFAARAAKLAPKRAPARARPALPGIKPALDTARARVHGTLERLRAPPAPKPESARPIERPAPEPERTPEAKPVDGVAPAPAEPERAQETPPPRPKSAARASRPVTMPAWVKSAAAAIRRPRPTLTALLVVLALAGGAWWMQSERIWPFGSAGPTPSPDTPQPAPPADTASPEKADGADAAARAQPPSDAKTDSAEEKAPAPAEPKRSQLIADIQTELKRLEVYDGPIDGIDGPHVRAALSAARAKYEISGPMTASKRLLTRLRNQLVQQPLAVTAPAPPPPPPQQAAEAAPAPVVQPARPKNVAPTEYPRGALGREIEGWVDVTFDIDPEGDVQNARVTAAENARAEMYFSEPALKAIRATNFYPALEGNKPVWSRGVVRRFVFTLQQNR